MNKEPSRGALEVADELIKDIQDAADRDGAHYAPCFRDCLGDNQEWIRVLLARALDETADGRSLRTGPDGPY